MYVLERSQVIPISLERAFRFFEDPCNLAEITPPWLDFRIVKADGLPLRAGSRIEYRIRWLGMPRRWCTLIEAYEPRRRFVDVQNDGPYRLWRHEHVFEDLRGATLMRDRVQYELPFGFLGRMAHKLLVRRQVRQIFDYRAWRIGEIFPETIERQPDGNEGRSW
jgi:ligand-binding SRPBCC domain-containing protein